MIKVINEEKYLDRKMFIHPMADIFSKRIGWYESESGNVIGTIVLDKSDRDYQCIVSGRDQVGEWRCIDLVTSIEKIEDATQQMFELMEKYIQTGKSVFPQEDIDEEDAA